MTTKYGPVIIVRIRDPKLERSVLESIHYVDYIEDILSNQESVTTDEMAEDYGIRTSTLNEYLEAKGFQHWQYDRWICDLEPADRCCLGHDGQYIIWSPAARLAIFFELKSDGFYPLSVA